ncbi:DUF4258 domain-containing protein [Paenibacillus medicaginis]|uniref:DUF4258 domain-containing protein n=1 Tax=Paenibacillus medicaginis TaxID=1470560 RepID=A0ABV5BV95_9BACL
MNPLSKSELFAIVKMLAYDNAIIFTKHARERMNERKFNIYEVKDILMNPRQYVEARYDESKGYTYKIKGGKKRFASIVLSINNENTMVIVVTVI